jgi:hypothetical protein
MMIPLITLIISLLSSCAASAGSASGAAKTAGFNWVAEGFEGPGPYDSPANLASLKIAVDAGINSFSLSFAWYIASMNSTGPIYPVPGGCPSGAPFNNASSPSNASITAGIRAVHALGAKVVLRPMIDPHWSATQHGDSAWRGGIGTKPAFTPAQWDEFFVHYSAYMLSWAAVAEAEGVETLCIGAELSSTEPLEAHWRALFAEVRAVYHGTVYYSSTGGDFPWWNASDFIAQDMYPSLSNETAAPDGVAVDDLVAAWGKYLGYFHGMSVRHNKTVLLQETGICSVNRAGIYHQPAFFECYGLPIDESVQAKYYDSVFKAVYGLPWIEGVTFWKWASQGGPKDPTFFPLNKSTMDVIKQNLLPSGGRAL